MIFIVMVGMHDGNMNDCVVTESYTHIDLDIFTTDIYEFNPRRPNKKNT